MRFEPEDERDPRMADDDMPEDHIMRVNNLRRMWGRLPIEIVHAGHEFDVLLARLGASGDGDSFVLHMPAGKVTVRR